MWLDLLSTFVLTSFLIFTEEDIQTSFSKTLSRGSVLHPTLPVVLALFRMLSLARYSEPELDPMWVVLWCITVVFYFLLLSVSSVHLLGGLYCDVPSDIINVYQPPGIDICNTFKSSLMRGRFTLSET